MGTTSGGVRASTEGSTTPCELGAQIRAALEHVHQSLSVVTATTHVRHQDTGMPVLATAEVWKLSVGAGAPCRVCDLPAPVNLGKALVDEALDQPEASYPCTHGLRARRQRLTDLGAAAPVYERVVSLREGSKGGPTWER